MFGRGVNIISQTPDTQNFVNTNHRSGINDIQISRKTWGTTIGEPRTCGGFRVAGAENSVGPHGDAMSGRESDPGSVDGIDRWESFRFVPHLILSMLMP